MNNRKDQVESWYRNYGKNVVKWTKARSLQDAEDILQNTAISLLTNPADWEEISRKRVHKFTNYDYYNRSNKDKAHFGSKFESLDGVMNAASSSNLTDELIARKSVELVQKLANELQGKSREIFLMRFFEDVGYEEIADRLNMPYKSVKQLGSRAAKIVTGKFREIVK